MDFPERSNMKAPRGFKVPLGAFLFAFLYGMGVLLMGKGVIKGKRDIKYSAIKGGCFV